MTRRKAARRARPLPLPIANGIRLPPAGWLDPTPVSMRTKERVEQMTAPFTFADLQDLLRKIRDAPPSLFEQFRYIDEGGRVHLTPPTLEDYFDE